MVIWLIGLSSSGKSTIAQEMVKILNTHSSEKWALIDGDNVRQIFPEALGHSVEDRKKNAIRIQSLSKFLDTQNINAVVAILSIFPEMQKENRTLFSSYKQVYIKVSRDKLLVRDNKGLLKKALTGEIADFVGVQIPFPEPLNSDLVFDNNNDSADITSVANSIIKNLNLLESSKYPYPRKITQVEKYQYTPYTGNLLVESYLANRNSKLQLIEANLSKLGATPSQSLLQQLASEYFKKIDSRLEYVILDKLLSDFIAKDSYLKNSDSLQILVKKYEVSKKLHRFYESSSWKKVKENVESVTSYPLLSYSLLSLAKKSKPREAVIFLNTALKINDRICQDLAHFTSSFELLCVYYSLKFEFEILEKLQGSANDL